MQLDSRPCPHTQSTVAHGSRTRALPRDSKAASLVQAVRMVMDRPADRRKVVIFTESLTTQDYLRGLLLEQTELRDEDITLFRGNNDSPRAREALDAWRDANGQGARTPSASVAVRLALVDEFRQRFHGPDLVGSGGERAEPAVLRHRHQLRPAVEPAADRAADRPLPPLRADTRRHLRSPSHRAAARVPPYRRAVRHAHEGVDRPPSHGAREVAAAACAMGRRIGSSTSTVHAHAASDNGR